MATKKILTFGLILIMLFSSLGLEVKATPYLGSYQTTTATLTDYNNKSGTATKYDETPVFSTSSAAWGVFQLQLDDLGWDNHYIVTRVEMFQRCTTGTTTDVQIKDYTDAVNSPDAATAAQINAAIPAYDAGVTYLQLNNPSTSTSYQDDLSAQFVTNLNAALAADLDWFAFGQRVNSSTNINIQSQEYVSDTLRPKLIIHYYITNIYYYNIGQRVYENGATWAGAYSVTVTDSNGDTTIIAIPSGQTEAILCDNAVEIISYPATATYDRYRYNPAVGTTTLYAPASGTTVHPYLWTIRDLLGVAQGGFIRAERIVNSALVIADEQRIIDSINGVPLILAEANLYQITVIEDDLVTTHPFGYFLATDSNLSPILTLSSLSFDQEMQFVTSSLPIVATRSADKATISLTWANTLTPTYNLTISTFVIKNRAGTVVYSTNSTAQSGTFTKAALTNSTDYVAYYTADSEYFGDIDGAWAFEGFDNYADIPELSDLGLTFGGINPNGVLGVGMVMFVAGIFSAGSAPVGAVVTVLVGGVLARMGFLTITDTLLAVALSLAIMYALGRRGGG